MTKRNEVIIEVDSIKIKGKIKGKDERIELIMDNDKFKKWKNKLKEKRNER
jgi:hypothetical protein